MEESIIMRLIIKPLKYLLIAIIVVGVVYGLIVGDMRRGFELYMGMYHNTAGKVVTWYMENRIERVQNRMERNLKALQDNQTHRMKQKYTDRDNNSNIAYTEYGSDWITVDFEDRSQYTYTYQSAGADAIEKMKVLADQGDGLNSYISTHLPGYASKQRY